jgi:hypothetical protein
MEDTRVLNIQGGSADVGLMRSGGASQPVRPAAVAGQLALLAVMGVTLMLPALPRASRPNLAHAQADAVAAAIEVEAAAAVHILAPIAARLRAGEAVDWKQFSRLTETGNGAASVQPPELRFFAWLPWVPAAARDAYERRTGDDGYRSFRVMEIADPGAMRAAARREHLPLHLTSAAEATGALLGLDLAADTELRAAAERARRSGEPELVGPRRLLELPSGAPCPAPVRALAVCEPALALLIPVAEVKGTCGPGVLLATIPWSAIETAAGHRLQQAVGVSTVMEAGALIRPSGRRPSPPALLLPSSARGSFYLGQRLWTIDLRLPGLTARTPRR